MIGVIDYGMSNLASLSNALLFINAPFEVTDSPSSLKKYDKLILPGVGAFGLAMKRLNESGFSDAILEEVCVKEKNILGICLGMQLLYEKSSEHGQHQGLGLIKGSVEYLGEKVSLPVPHVGWNSVFSPRETNLLRASEAEDYCFYFVHSFYCQAKKSAIVSGVVEYGGFKFDAVVEDVNVMATQFHPEKSQKNGLELLKKFSLC